MNYSNRAADKRLAELSDYFAAVAVEGAKGVGKTETASQIASKTIYLDQPSGATILDADPGLQSFAGQKLLIDEWQLRPEVWDVVRRAVDRGAEPGSFILTGSATPAADARIHTGAGRIISFPMRPMAYFERYRPENPVSLQAIFDREPFSFPLSTEATITDYAEAISESGFPGIYKLPKRMRQVALDSYIDRIVDKELPQAGHSVRIPATLMSWLSAYGAASSTVTGYSAIFDAANGNSAHQPDKKTTDRYRDILTSLWVLDPVPGWNHLRNPLKNVTVSPKHQLVDPALVLRLQNMTEKHLFDSRGSHLLGPLFESLATLSVRTAAAAIGAKVSHLRTQGGRQEIDLIVENSDGDLVAVEVKTAASVGDKDVKHLHWFRETFGEDVCDLVVIYAGALAYRRQDGVLCIPLSLLTD